ADHDVAALHLDVGDAFDLVEIDDVGRRGEPQLHRRQQGLAAGEELRLFELAEHVGGLAQPAGAVIGEIVHRCRPRYFAECAAFVLRIAAHTAWGVAGIAMSSEPIASVIAFITAAGAAIAPASPQPLMPSGLDGHLVTVVSTVNDGRLSARGMV